MSNIVVITDQISKPKKFLSWCDEYAGPDGWDVIGITRLEGDLRLLSFSFKDSEIALLFTLKFK